MENVKSRSRTHLPNEHFETACESQQQNLQGWSVHVNHVSRISLANTLKNEKWKASRLTFVVQYYYYYYYYIHWNTARAPGERKWLTTPGWLADGSWLTMRFVSSVLLCSSVWGVPLNRERKTEDCLFQSVSRVNATQVVNIDIPPLKPVWIFTTNCHGVSVNCPHL
jgi:hypothetical protein